MLNESLTRYVRLFVILFLLMIPIAVGNYWLRGELGEIGELLSRTRDQLGTGGLIVGGMLYMLFLSIPFVPGVELGLLLMCLFGRAGIVFVYGCTVSGLLLAFAAGRCFSESRSIRWLKKSGITEISQNHADWMETALKHSRIGQTLHIRLGSSLLRYRYPVLAILFNLPGNSVLGGGGGIAMICGMSKLFQWKWFVLTVILATAPVPLLAFLGLIQLEVFFSK
ncbi:MAG: hypothetical protein GY801_18065 [bacterium]|nr:hypothetical protein [bacterium]